MILKTLQIQNFLSIREVIMELSDKGLVLIQGKNMDNDTFDNNGSGKSSLTEALVFVLFGKTIRNIKPDEVVHEVPNKNCVVGLTLIDDDGSEYIIKRYRKHKDQANNVMMFRNSTNITSKSDKDTNQSIIDLIQMDFLTFTSSLLYSEQSFKFTSATDSEMKGAFDTMLGFEILNRCQEVAKSLLKQTEFTLEASTEKVLTLENSALSQVDAIASLKEQYAEKTKQNELLLTTLKDDLKELKLELSTHIESQEDNTSQVQVLTSLMEKIKVKIDEFKELTDKVSNIKSDISSIISDIKGIDNLHRSVSSQLSSNKTLVSKHQLKYKRCEEEILNTKDTIGTPCPTCGVPLTEDKLQDAIDALKEKLVDIQVDIDESTQEVKNSEKELSSLVLQKTTKQTKKDELEKSLKTTQEKLVDKDSLRENYDQVNEQRLELLAEDKQFNKITEQINKRITANEISISNASSSVSSTYLPLIETAENKLKDIRASIKVLKDADKETIISKETYSFWVKGFSNQGIKSNLLDDITPFLNRRVNKYLSKLTNNSIEVKFSTQTLLKSGEKREKFSIDIKNINGSNVYAGNSGGERKRIDISVNMALQDLVASRSTKKLNICFYDEVFDALDTTGCESVIELLQDISTEKNSIFVITHNDALKSFFDNIITVIKENKYSRLEQ